MTALLTLVLVYTLAFSTFLIAQWHYAGKLPRRLYPWLALSPCLALIAVCCWVVIRYCISPLYLDHLEPTVAALSYGTFWNGLPLYHGEQADSLYELPYGPALFLLNAIPYALTTPTIQLGKLVPVLALCASAGLLCQMIWQRFRRVDLTLAGLVAFSSMLMSSYQPTFWNRPEPFLIACACLGLWASQLRNHRVAATVLALAIATAVNLKPHAALYLVPALCLFAKGRHWRNTAACLLLAGLLAGLPWLLPNISLRNYLWTLQQTAHHPLLQYMFLGNLQFLLTLSAPVLLLALLQYSQHKAQGKRLLGIWLLLFLCGLPVAIIASKAGAGKHHLLPFAPAWILLTLRAWTYNHADSWLGRQLKVTLLAFLAMSAANAAAIQLGVLDKDFLEAEANQRLAQQELQSLILRYQGQPLEMGVASSPTYEYSYLRPYLVFAGMPYHLDTASLMDIEYSGVSASSRLSDSMAACTIPRWVIPRAGFDIPFSINNFYYDDQALENWTAHDKHLFDLKFRNDFQQHYQREFSGKIFDVYRCRQ